MGFFDLFKIKKALSPEPLDNKSIFPEQINFSQSAKASDNYCQKFMIYITRIIQKCLLFPKTVSLILIGLNRPKTFSQQSPCL